jgi:hypothetical protein
MRAAAATTATAAAASGIARWSGIFSSARGEHGEFLRQFFGVAVRTGSAVPLAGANEDFAVLAAVFTVKFVNRHANKINDFNKSSRALESRADPILQKFNHSGTEFTEKEIQSNSTTVTPCLCGKFLPGITH